MRQLHRIALAIAVAVLAAAELRGREPDFPPSQSRVSTLDSTIVTKAVAHVIHRVNRLKVAVNNGGQVGTMIHYSGTVEGEIRDLFTGELIPWTEFPAGSGRRLWPNVNLWVGAQTPRHRRFVSCAGGGPFSYYEVSELVPDEIPGIITRRSSLSDDPDFDPNAIGEEDLIASSSDTRVIMQTFAYSYLIPNQDSIPIRVTQVSSGWSLTYAEDFLLVNLTVEYTGSVYRDSLYIALAASPTSAFALGSGRGWPTLPIVAAGFLNNVPSRYGCEFVDTVNVFWGGSVDGNLFEGRFVDKPIFVDTLMSYIASNRGMMGLRVLHAPAQTLPMSFNWWGTARYEGAPNNSVSGGPSQDRSRKPADFGRTIPMPSDPEIYRAMANREFDHGSIFTGAVNRWHLGDWQPMDQSIADSMSKRMDGIDMMLAWGPFNMHPGAQLNLTYALVCGENFHTDPNNLSRLPHDPQGYLDHIDFSDLAQNALMTGWVYDNPGVDTDGDGYFGEYRICVHDSLLIDGNWVATRADTQWYKGDGIPDYRGALPPPSPDIWVSQTHNGLHIRFNGQYSEMEKDIFLQKPDWEGYRIYLGRDERETSLSLIGSYDRLDFDKLYFNFTLAEGPEWQLLDQPFTLDSLRCLYGAGPEPCRDTTFDPLNYTQVHPYHSPAFPDSIFAFVPHDYNTSDLGLSTPVVRTYPDVSDPRRLPSDSMTPDMYTEDGYLKFYEYEFTIENLLPTVPYYVSVTAIDFGSPAQGLEPLESSKYDNITEAFPLHELDAPLSGSDKVYVYPNPYRIDVDYRDLGYEGRAQDDRWDERVRSIWFGNLPPKCTINIFTLDGDRVRTIEHDVPVTDPTYSKERWDLINRNFQIIVSGLYYWTVESEGKETQIGKLAVLR